MSRVTVLVPNFNNGRFLQQCLDSVRQQGFEDWQVVVGDNASTDDSADIVEGMGDARIRLVRRPRTIGWVANVNLLLSETVGSDYIALLHADDWWEPTFVSTMVRLLDGSPRSLMATCAARQVDEAGVAEVNGMHRFWAASHGPTCPPSEASRILATKGCRAWAPSVLARREMYSRLGGFDEALPQACDWLMWLRAATIASVEVWPEPLANYRVHSQNQTAQLTRANLRGIDLVRLVQVMEAEWRGREPFKGAAAALAAAVLVELLADAAVRAEAGDHDGAMRQARLARAVAPSARWAAMASIGGTAIQLGRVRALGGAQRRLLQIGRLAWHASQGTAPRETK